MLERPSRRNLYRYAKMRPNQINRIASFILLLAIVAFAQAQISTPASKPSPAPASSWIGSWASSQQIPEPDNALPPDSLKNATLRQILHLSVGGSTIRVRVSNAFGTTPLHLLAVHVARPQSPAASRIDPASDLAIKFNEREEVLIPGGAEYISDPVNYTVAPLSDLAITMRVEVAPVQETGHPGSRATSYLSTSLPASAPELTGARPIDHWYFLSGVDVSAPANASAIVALGDSITDGHGATTNGNDRWTDDLALQLQHSASTRSIAVLNEGIGGNHLLTDGLGPNVLARFDRDVLAQNGVRYVIVFEGINDLGGLTILKDASEMQHEDLVSRMIGAYSQIILRAHAHGIKAIGGTITPFMGSGYYHPTEANEVDRRAVNAWIRASGHFDAVIDFDKVVADPAHPDHLRAEYDCGDHLHPNPAGYRAMAGAIPLELFQ